MTNRRLKIIIALMSIALLSLIIIQFFWIKGAVKENEKRFDLDIAEVINAVSNKLEQKEVVSITKSFFLADTKDVSDANNIQFDSLKIYEYKRPYDIKNRSFNPEIFTDHNYEIKVDVDDKDALFNFNYKSKDENNKVHSNDIKIELKHYSASIDSVMNTKSELSKNIEKVRERSQMLTIVLNELYSKERKLTNRINKPILDSLVRAELQQRRINSPYVYGVIDHKTDSFLILGKHKYSSAYFENQNVTDWLEKSSYRVNLFRQDINGSPSEFVIDFPKRNKFIFKQILLTLTSSFILLFIIIFAFGYSINTIINQKKLSEIKDDFINNMTHELKTPISTISLACEALSDKEMQANTNILSRYLQIISDENHRLGAQVEKVLQIARMEKQDVAFNLETIDFHQVIRQVASTYNLLIQNKQGKLILNLDAKNSHLISDRAHLNNIVNNILDNANKYTINKAPYIVVSTQDSLEGIVLRITDNGIGISKESQKHIFEKFYREPTGNRHDVKGFGLGLAYVNKTVLGLKGRICVYSSPQKGSTFELYFPYE